MSDTPPWADLAILGLALALWAAEATGARRERRRRLEAEAQLQALREASTLMAGQFGAMQHRLVQGWMRDSVAAAVHCGAIHAEPEACPQCGSMRSKLQCTPEATWKATCEDCGIATQPNPTPATAWVAWRIAEPLPKGGA